MKTRTSLAGLVYKFQEHHIVKSAYNNKFTKSAMLLFILLIGAAAFHLLPVRTEASKPAYRQDRILVKPRASIANLQTRFWPFILGRQFQL
jgi:hypothetical protein